MATQQWQNIQVKQLSEAQRKLGILPSGYFAGGAAGTVLTKASPADYDFLWSPILGGIVLAGNGIVFSGGNTINFAQAAAYTTGAIPFASGAATIGFDAANLFWDTVNNRLGVGTNAPADLFHVDIDYADALLHYAGRIDMDTSVVGGTKRALVVTAQTTGAAAWNAGLIGGATSQSLHQGSNAVTAGGSWRHVGHEIYHGKGLLGTGAMDATVGLFVQSLNQNVTGAIAATYDVYIRTPITTGAITANYAIYQESVAGFNYFGSPLSIGTAAFSSSIMLRIQRAYTVTTDVFGVYALLTNTASGLSAASHFGASLSFTLAGAQNYTAGRAAVYGLDAQAYHSGSGTCTGINGVRIIARKTGTGAVTRIYGLDVFVGNTNATGAVTTGYGIYLNTPGVTGAITTYYGLYVAAGAGTTVYGIAQVGTSDLNYLAGYSAFGSASPVNTTFALFGASTAAISSQRILRGSAAYAGTVEGDFWNDYTQHCLIGYVAGVKQFDSRVLFVQTADATITNTNVETTMFGAGIGTLTLPANFFVVGKTIRLNLRGVHTMDATPPSTVYRVKLGGVTFATITFADANDTNQYFELDFLLTCRTTGVGGTAIGQGVILMHESTGATTADFRQLVMTATAALDTTIARILDVTAQPAVADAGSSITITNAIVEIAA